MKFSIRLIKKTLFVLILITGFSFSMDAQNVTVASTVGTSSATYTTLGSGFTAINAGTHKGVITITISGNTSESTSGAVINASGSGSASYSSIRIIPRGAITVSAAVTTGSPLIGFNGADNVTIDGLNTGGNSLTLSNTTCSDAAGTSTLRFYGDATSNKITNCTILGSSTMTTTSNGGTIWFDASAVSVGNDNDTISNCDIGPAGTNLPAKSIYACGTTTSIGKYNSGIIITGNNIYDYFHAVAQSNGIYISAGNTGWTISNNKFYQTASRTQTTGSIHAPINIASAVGNENMAITGNTIGYSSSSATGTYTFVGVSSASKFYPIYISAAPAAGVPTSIQGNTITAISVSGPLSGEGYWDLPPFAGIYVGDDTTLVNIGTVTGNIIGSKTASGAITFSSSSTTLSDVYGIFFFPLSNANINNNSVGGMTISNSSTGPIAFYGIRAFTWVNFVNVLRNDTVGFAAAPIRISASCSTSKSMGILSDFGTPIITGSTVSNITMDGANVLTGTRSALTGICADRTSYYYSGQLNALNDSILDVSSNTVHSLSNTSSAAVTVNGLVINGDTSINETVSKNFIHSLSVANTSATINGINIISSNADYSNNMIRLGIDASGANITTACKINGINEVGGTNNFYFNSIYVGGTSVGTTVNNTFALTSAVITTTRKFRNNIFQNSRSNASTGGKHYAIKVGGTTANPTGLTINNNIYYANGTGGVLGYYNTSDVTTLATWKTTVGQDANSYSTDPSFRDATSGATTVDLHLQSLSNRLNPAEGVGAAITGFNQDFDGQDRSLYTPSDIGADAGNFCSISITYTNLINGNSVSNRRTTSFASVRANGVVLDTLSGTRPRFYYKKKTDANSFSGNTSTSNGWKNIEGISTSSPFDFTIDYSLLYNGSVSFGDTIQYFVTAQDMNSTPNAYSNPSTGFVGTSVSRITTAPTTPNFYIVERQNIYVKSTGRTDSVWYSTLGNAFTAINSGTHTGTVLVTIVANTSEPLSGAVINASGSGSASYSSIRITPSGNITVSAAITSGSSLIGFNGADNVTIDGLNTGGNSLTLSNTTRSDAAGTSTIRFYGDATSNKITNCTILGSSTMTTTNNGGTIWFDSSAISVGNDNDTISNCNIGPAGTNLPAKSIYACGTTTSIAKYNSGIIITGNNIYDYFHAMDQSNGIYISAGNTGWTISNNKFYQTASRTQTTGSIHAPINIASTVGNENMAITGNTIGYSSSSTTGTYTFVAVSSAAKFYPIYFSAAASTGTASSVQGNTITAISISGEPSGTGNSSPFAGIMIQSGLVNVGTTSGNIVGSRTSSRGITYTSTSVSTGEVSGIYFSPTLTTNINNNAVGGITLSNTSTGGIIFYGIRASSSTTVINTIQYDTIGFALAPITNTATATTSQCIGIASQLGASVVTNCIVRKMYMVAANTGTGTTSSLMGIYIDGSSATGTAFYVSNNSIYSLINSAASGVVVNGIVYNGPSALTNIISKNIIYSLAVSNTAATINGIYTAAGNATFGNNRIRLGNDTNGSSNLASPCKIYGINAAGSGTTKYFYNTIYINGTVSSGSTSSICIYRSGSEITSIKNNLCYNERTGGTGAHIAIGTVNNTNFTCDYNLYITTDTSLVGIYNSSNYNFTNWKRNSNSSNSSWCALNSQVNSDSLFTDKNNANLSIKTNQTQGWYVNGKGVAGANSGSIDVDYEGQTRCTTLGMGTDIGSDEFTPTTTPPLATQVGTIANNQITRYIFAGREVANIRWKNAVGTTTSFPSAISAYYYSGTNPPDPTNGGHNPGAKYMNSFWILHPTGGGHFLYDVTLTYDEALLGTLASESDIKLGKKPDVGNTGDWKVHYGSSVNTSTNTVQFESLNGFSVFALSDNTSALPVSLIEFTAQIDNDNVLLKWSSAREINSSHYNIMRSFNGSDYEKIGVESSAGNSTNISTYSFVDENAIKLYEGKSIYYKLAMVDLDGTAKFSPVRTVFFKNALSVNSMTPYFSDENLNIKLKLNDDTKLNISVVDMNGKIVYTSNAQYAKGVSTTTLNGMDIPTGIYLIKMESASETMVVKVFKK